MGLKVTDYEIIQAGSPADVRTEVKKMIALGGSPALKGLRPK